MNNDIEEKVWDLYNRLQPANTILCKEFGIERNNGATNLVDIVSSPWREFQGVELYPTSTNKIRKLGMELVRQHIYLDGNKRMALVAMEMMADILQLKWNLTQREKYDAIMRVATGEYDSCFTKDEDFVLCEPKLRTIDEIIEENKLSLEALGNPGFEW